MRLWTLGAVLAGGLVLAGCGGSKSGSEDGGSDATTDAGTELCDEDVDCADGVFCNGVERCAPEDPGAGDDGCVAGRDPCGDDQSCDEDAGRCEEISCETPDADGDSHDSVECGGDDCDDADPDAFPGNAEVCDAEGHDEDCDPETLGDDADGDGFVSDECCNLTSDGLSCGADCDDTQSTVNPSATEACNRIDEDCDGDVDEGALETFYQDMDGDGVGRDDVTMMACSRPADYAGEPGDCDDTDVNRFPGATEVCNGEDTNCDGTPDNPPDGCSCTIGEGPRDCGPGDGEGGFETRGICQTGTQSCTGGTWGTCEGAVGRETETCDGRNEDCDDTIDEDAIDRTTYYEDADGDSFGNPAVSTVVCPSDAPSGYVENDADCDDTDASVRPTAAETCDGENDDCDESTDEAPAADSCGSVAGTTFACMGGTCAVASCDSDVGDCDSDPGNGCETTLVDNRLHCGACDNVCSLECTGTSCDDIAAVGAGEEHACGVREDGGLVCWGNNDEGQLGDGTQSTRGTPVEASLSDVSQVAGGRDHTCAVTGSGSAYCWGDNSQNQAHAAGMMFTTTPNEIGALSGNASAVATGWFHSCAIVDAPAAGSVECWGLNAFGQWGADLSTTTDPNLHGVKDIGGSGRLAGVTAIAAGQHHTCAIVGSGSVVCWGLNSDQQLGSAVDEETCAQECSRAPVEVPGITQATHIAAGVGGNHTCIRNMAGEVWCWGDNARHQVDGSATSPLGLTLSLTGASDVAAAGSHTCAVETSGQLVCWGDGTYGQLGNGATGGDEAPSVDVTGLTDASAVGLGRHFSCAIRASGPTVCWGRDQSKQLGDDDVVADQDSPVAVAPL